MLLLKQNKDQTIFYIIPIIFFNQFLIEGNAVSIGFKSGEYGERNKFYIQQIL